MKTLSLKKRVKEEFKMQNRSLSEELSQALLELLKTNPNNQGTKILLCPGHYFLQKNQSKLKIKMTKMSKFMILDITFT